MQWNDEIIGLWPTPVLSRLLTDNELLEKLIAIDAGSDSTPIDLATSDDPAIRRLHDIIASAVAAYFKTVDADPAPSWRVQARFNRLPYGASQGLKNSPNAFLRGVYYLRTPSVSDNLHMRGDTRPGHLTLYDPRPGINMLSIKGDPYREQAMTVEPQPGLLLLWPGFVNDFRHPNLARDSQLSVDFEVVADTEGGSHASQMPWDGNIEEMWPTGFLKRRLPQHEAPNQELIRVIDELERDNPNLTTDFNTNRFRDYANPAVDWLMSNVNQSVTEYFKQFKMNFPISWEIASWSNVNRFGDYHSPHTHPWSYLSGTYYVQVPEPAADSELQSELLPAGISFRDPRSMSAKFACAPGSRFGPLHTIKPVAGALLMWPSAVYHFVHPNLAEQKRYSISFNIHLKVQPHFF